MRETSSAPNSFFNDYFTIAFLSSEQFMDQTCRLSAGVAGIVYVFDGIDGGINIFAWPDMLCASSY